MGRGAIEDGKLNESVVMLDGDAYNLVGIVTAPARQPPGASRPAVVFLNAGFLHRVGPNRLYVRLARALATMGHLTLRFDFSGIGDSPARRDRLSSNQAYLQETLRAMDHVERQFGIGRFIMFGLCSGADVAFIAALRDPRVAAAILINPSVGGNPASAEASPGTLQGEVRSSTQMRYYRKKIGQWRSWMRLLTFKSDYRVAWRTLRDTSMRALRKPNRPRTSLQSAAFAPLRTLLSRDVQLLGIYSEGSETLDLLRLSFGANTQHLAKEFPNLRIEEIKDVDHVFTPLWAQDVLATTVQSWVSSLKPPPERDAPESSPIRSQI